MLPCLLWSSGGCLPRPVVLCVSRRQQLFVRLSVDVHEHVDIQVPDSVACGKRWQRSGTDFHAASREPEPVGEASRAGKLPQSPVAVAMCISFERQQSTKHCPAAQFTSTLPSIRPTLGTLRHRTPYYSSLVKTFRSRTTTRDNPFTPSRAALSFPGALYNAIVRSARRQFSLRVHSSICIPSIPPPNTAIRYHVVGLEGRLP